MGRPGRFEEPSLASTVETDRLRQLAKDINCQQHVFPSTVELPDLEADDELIFVGCLRQVDAAVIVDRAEQVLGGVVGILAVRRVLKGEQR